MEILIPLLLPLVTAALIQVLGRFTTPNIRDGAHTLMAAITFYFVLQLIDPVMNGTNRRCGRNVPVVCPSELNHWTMFALVASGLWIPTSVYAFVICDIMKTIKPVLYLLCLTVGLR